MDSDGHAGRREVPSLDELESLIGQRVRYRNHVWRIVEVLEREQALVLQAEDEGRRVLTDAQGEPVSDLARVQEIPLRDPETGERNQLLESIEILEDSPGGPN